MPQSRPSSISTWALPPSSITAASHFHRQHAQDSVSRGGGEASSPEDGADISADDFTFDRKDWLLHRVACGPGDDQHLFELITRWDNVTAWQRQICEISVRYCVTWSYGSVNLIS